MTSENRLEKIDRDIEAAKARKDARVAVIREREQKKIDQLRARRQAAEARARKAARKLDTRRKIILGGALIGQARLGNPAAQDMLDALLAGLPDREQPLFEGWSP